MTERFTEYRRRLLKALRVGFKLLRYSALRGTDKALFLYVGQDGKFGNYYQRHNVRTLYHLLSLLGNFGHLVYISGLRDKNREAYGGAIDRFDFLRWYWGKPESAQWAMTCVDDSNPIPIHAASQVHLHYDYQPALSLPPGHFIVPYGMAIPVIESRTVHDIPRLRTQPRKIRVLFAGRFDKTNYDKQNHITERFGKITRYQAITALKEANLVREVSTKAELDALLSGDYVSEFILINSAKIPTSGEKWLEFLSRTDFFLCAPGTIMPMCHNIIEVMSVGTIPITNYGDWFIPALTPDQNHIGFTTTADLVSQMQRVQAMTPQEVAALRAGVLEYYECYLDPAYVGQQIVKSSASDIHLHILDETYNQLSQFAALKSEIS